MNEPDSARFWVGSDRLLYVAGAALPGCDTRVVPAPALDYPKCIPIGVAHPPLRLSKQEAAVHYAKQAIGWADVYQRGDEVRARVCPAGKRYRRRLKNWRSLGSHTFSCDWRRENSVLSLVGAVIV